MTNTNKVIGFLDIANWDYDLAFVMIGAIAVMFVAYHYVAKRSAPLFADSFGIPTNTAIDKNLIIGSILFGIGWGLYGLCPGPAIISLLYQQSSIYMFFIFMMIGFLLGNKIKQQ